MHAEENDLLQLQVAGESDLNSGYSSAGDMLPNQSGATLKSQNFNRRKQCIHHSKIADT